VNSTADIHAETISDAWVEAVASLLATPSHAAVHFGVRIARPAEPETAEVRAAADRLLARGRLQEITSVRSTIFPVSWADRFPEPEELAQHYREHYATIRRFQKNRTGTYFGRLVAYPVDGADEGATFDQLGDLVKKLRAETSVAHGRRRSRRLSSRYEVSIWKPGDLPTGMGFPCLAHLSFTMVEGALHLLAQYRNQYVIERAYGNYLGLAGLQAYIARSVGLASGELMILASHASLDTHAGIGVSAIRETLESIGWSTT
jgi:hypothetical protein